MLRILQQTEELSRHTAYSKIYYSKINNLAVIYFMKDPNFEFKNNNKKFRIWRFLKILTCIKFRQTSAINIYFLHTLYARNTTANERI